MLIGLAVRRKRTGTGFKSARQATGSARAAFYLQRGMGDAIALCQHFFNGGPDMGCFRCQPVGNDDMAGQSVKLGRQTPDMQIMDFFNTGDGTQGCGQLFQADMGGCSLKEHGNSL